jgi:uncharacterized protein
MQGKIFTLTTTYGDEIDLIRASLSLHGDALKIRVAAQPVEGRANSEIIRFLAEKFVVPQRDIHLISGETSRQKRFRIICVIDSTIDPASLLDSE